MENLVYKGKVEKERTFTEKLLFDQRKKGKEAIAGEIEKNDEDLQMIDVINKILAEEFKELDIPFLPISVDSARVHFFSHDVFQKNLSVDSHTHASYVPEEQYIALDVSRFKNKLTKFSSLLHEAIHYVGFQKFSTVLRTDGSQKAISNRSGYNITTGNGWDLRQGGLKRFNEGVVDAITYKLLKDNLLDLEHQFNINPEDLPQFQDMNYGYYSNIIGLASMGIAENEGVSTDEAWRRIIKGEFTGEMMHLRAVEHAYGKDALRVFAALDNPDREERFKAKGLISKFFSLKNKNNRSKIKEEIFSIEDWNQRKFHEKRRREKEKKYLKTEVEKLQLNKKNNGEPFFNGYEELAAIMSSDNSVFNPNVTEAVGTSEGGIEDP